MATLKSTQDIRARAMESKRAAESKHKWNPKWNNCDDAVNTVPDYPKRLARHLAKRVASSRRGANAKAIRCANEQRKLDRLGGADDALEDDNDMLEHSVAYESGVWESTGPALRVTDANRGPVQGSEVLTQAVTKAVRRFEDRQTTKLVHDEYEVVDDSDGRDDSHAGTTDEDDFELV